MPYLIDRGRALRAKELVAIVRSQRRGARSTVILEDNSLHHTLTRPRTLLRAAEEQRGPVVQIGARPPRTHGGAGRQAWRTSP